MIESFEIDETSKSGLRRKKRPLEHFKSKSACSIYNTKYAGNEAGGIKKCSGIERYMARFEGKDWQVARIVWAIHNKTDPGELHIDHIDGNAKNNRIENLRAVDTHQSLFNRKYQRNNPSGCAGVHKYKNKWKARIMAYGIEEKLGCFDNLQDAILARKLAEERRFGDFGFFASRGHKINQNNLL